MFQEGDKALGAGHGRQEGWGALRGRGEGGQAWTKVQTAAFGQELGVVVEEGSQFPDLC